jgi:uncharacterized coiled-coil DUF342 family protein
MSNTPETDAALYPMNQVDIVWPKFARKLERERDEAREKAERYRLEANSLMLQRDEARESLKHIGEYGTEEINAAIDLRQKLASALVERDEVQEKYDNLATEHMLAVNKLCEERDEAREQVNRYRYNLDLLPIKWDI